MVWARLPEGGFDGPLWPVNPKYHTLNGHAVIADAGDLPQAPTVALICTPPATGLRSFTSSAAGARARDHRRRSTLR